MILIVCLILFSSFSDKANSENLDENYNIVKSVLDYFQSRSVIFVFQDHDQDSSDKWNFLKLQILISSNNFYFSSLSVPSTVTKTLETRFQNGIETVVVLRADETLLQFLGKLSNKTDFSSFKWLLISSKTSKSVEKLKIPLNTEFIIARGNVSVGYNLTEVYDTRPQRKVTKIFGRWVPGRAALHLAPSECLFHRRKNLEGATIKVLSSKKDPCTDISFEMGVAPIVQCIHKRIWDILAEMLNATTDVVLVPELDHDAIHSTDADLTFRSAPLNSFDLNTRAYIWPVFRTRVELVTSYISQKVEWRTFILPFSGEMWIVILIWMILCDLIIIGAEFMIERKKSRSFIQCFNKFSFTSVFVFCNQGVPTPSKFTSYRIIFLMMFLVTGIIFPGYSATLTSFLTIALHKTPFRNLEELSQTDEYKLGWHRSFPLENLFNLNDMSLLNKALLRNNVLPQGKMPATDTEGVEKMCSEKFTFLTNMDTILALKPKCRYYRLKPHFRVVFTSMEMQKNSWYQYFLNRCERSMDFTGIAYRIKLHTVMKYIRYDEHQIPEESNVSPIQMENIVLPFVVLFLGNAFSVFFLILELICYKRKSKQTG